MKTYYTYAKKIKNVVHERNHSHFLICTSAAQLLVGVILALLNYYHSATKNNPQRILQSTSVGERLYWQGSSELLRLRELRKGI